MKKNENKELTIVVFGKHAYPALDIIRCLGSGKYRVSLFLINNGEREYKIVSKSRYLHEKTRIKMENENAVIKKLLKFGNNIKGQKLLFPIDDYSVYMMDKYMDKLEKVYDVPINNCQNQGDLKKLLNKHNQSIYAQKSGMNVIKEWVVDLSDNNFDISEIKYPCYIKPIDSVSGEKSEHRKCNNENELSEQLVSLRNAEKNRSFLIQEYVKVDTEYTVLGVCTKNDVLIAGINYKIEPVKYAPGLTLVGILEDMEKVDGFPEIKKSIISFLKSLGYIGLFGLDINRSGGKLIFNEINCRPSGAGYCVKRAGFNMPKMFIDSYFDKTIKYSDYGKIEYGKMFIRERMAMEDYIQSKTTLFETLKLLKRAEVRLMNDRNDPAPEVAFYYQYIKSIVKLKIKRFIFGSGKN